jgi:signal transduction histidine kinase
LYRIAQEALNNIAHHAHATLADIRLSLMDSKVHMEIQDNGTGFTVSGFTCAEKPKRLGLLGMKERVEMVGGQFDIDSAPGCPTTIRVTLPSQPTKRARAKIPS